MPRVEARRFVESRASELAHRRIEEFASAVEADRSGAPKPLLVYQPGKVGSTTIQSTLSRHYGSDRVEHVHGLTDGYWRGWLDLDKGDGAGEPYLAVCREMASRARLLRLRIEAGSTEGSPRWMLVTAVRDPVAMTVSAAFHLAELLYPGLTRAASSRRRTARHIPSILTAAFSEQSAERLTGRDAFMKDAATRMFEVAWTWWQLELPMVFGLDPYAARFPHGDGYAILENDVARLLTIRFEDIPSRLPTALREFTGVVDSEGFELVASNVTGEKPYGREYRSVVEGLHFPGSVLTRVLNSKHVRHFYTDEEIDGFFRRWSD